MKIKICSLVSMVMSLLYYSPWVGEVSRVKLAPYIVAFIWFLFIWLLMAVYFYRAFSLRKVNISDSLLYLKSALLILLSYVLVLIGVFNGYSVTV